MLKDASTFSSFSVNDTAQAKQFYGEVLGLHVEDLPMPDLIALKLSDGHQVVIYTKPNHQPATYTVLNFKIPNIEQTVDELTALGVKFEVYEMDHLKTDAKGIMRGHGPTIAWFKDPSGNFLSLIEE